jgi:hypothetical protein
MQKRVLMAVIAGMVCLAADVRPALAAKVQSGAMDICRFFDGGTHMIVNGTELCCAHERRGDDEQGHGSGQYYCVECDPPGSNDCELSAEAGSPSNHINTILLRLIRAQQEGILVEQQGIRSDLNLVLAGLAKLEAQVDEVQDACTALPRSGSAR